MKVKVHSNHGDRAFEVDQVSRHVYESGGVSILLIRNGRTMAEFAPGSWFSWEFEDLGGEAANAAAEQTPPVAGSAPSGAAAPTSANAGGPHDGEDDDDRFDDEIDDDEDRFDEEDVSP